MLRNSKDNEDALLDLLNWKLGPGKNLNDENVSARHLRKSRVNGFCPNALALLARQNPDRARAWTIDNQDRLSFDWPAAIHAGWIEFWPVTPKHVPEYLTQEVDAINWLIDHSEPKSNAVYNAFYRWDHDYQQPAQKWLTSKDGPPRRQAARAWLISRGFKKVPPPPIQT